MKIEQNPFADQFGSVESEFRIGRISTLKLKLAVGRLAGIEIGENWVNDFYTNGELKERIERVKEKSCKDGVFTTESEFSNEMMDIRKDFVTIHGVMLRSSNVLCFRILSHIGWKLNDKLLKGRGIRVKE